MPASKTVGRSRRTRRVNFRTTPPWFLLRPFSCHHHVRLLMIPAALLMVLAALLVPLSPRGKTMPIMTVSAAAIEVVPKDSYQEHQHRLLQDQREDLQQQDRRALNSSLVCNLIASVDEATEEKEFKCEDDDSGIVYSIENFSSDFEDLLLRTPERLYSGIQLDIRGAYISQDGQRFVIPHEATVGFPTSITNDADASAGTTVAPNRRRRLYRNESGAKTFLVVYVRDASGGKPDKNPSGFSNSIEDDVFGTHGDTLNLANVYESCSNGYLDFVPFVGKTTTNVQITNGVAEITISQTVDGALRGDIENAATVEAQRVLGNLPSQFNYVMFCLPYGSLRSGNPGWLGYAYLDHWKGVYNNVWCSSVSTLAHEVGHNLNLGHSGQGSEEYGDQIGFMGYGYNIDDGPVMCFNGPKTHELGWFTNYHVDLTFSDDYTYSGNLYGFADVTKLDDGTNNKMIVKLIGNTGQYTQSYVDYYISFNRKTGNNVGTREAADKVVVHASQYTYWGPKSLRVADLSAGDTVIVNVKGRDVIIAVTAIDLSADPAYATVNIYADLTQSPSVSISPSVSPSPSAVPSTSLIPTTTNAPSLMYYSLSTSYLFGEYYAASKSGVMFDITATEDIMIPKLDISFFFVGGSGVSGIDTDLEVYVKDGTYVGSANRYERWTLHMTRKTITPSSTDFLTTLDETIFPPLYIGSGQTKAIFITNRDANNYLNLAYSNSASDHSDDIVTITRGKFVKYEYFARLGQLDTWENVDFAFTGILYYKLSANFPSLAPTGLPSIAPTISFAPTISRMPSGAPTESMQPSLMPSDTPSGIPSVSVSPSTIPSDAPSSNPSVSAAPSAKPSKKPTANPTESPTHKPSLAPTDFPTPSPSRRPTRLPSIRPSRTQNPSGVSPSDVPSVSLVPTMSLSNNPSLAPIVSSSPSVASLSPSVKRFQVVTTTCLCTYPFLGISQEQLSARFDAMIALWTKAITAKVPKDQWGVRIVRVGNRDVRARRLSLQGTISNRDLQSTVIDVEVEFTNINICESTDGCTESDVSESYQEGLNVIATVVESVESGALVETIREEANSLGLADLVSEISIDQVLTDEPQTEIVDPTPFPSTDVTSAPSVSPPSPNGPSPQHCDDSPFKFKVKFNGKKKSKTCEWVARHPSWKCQLEGVSSHCPQSCGTCGICSDSMVRFIVDSNNATAADKSCEWVARKNTEMRCSIPGIAETCRSTCDNCCSDSAVTFSLTFNGNELVKTCEWVARMNTEERCAVPEASYNCPKTCGTCCTDSSHPLSFTYNGNEIEKTCEWAARLNTEERCSVPEISLNCPRTCESCCNDVPYEFSFIFNGKQLTKNCEWVARVNTVERCTVPKVASNCAKTCGSCCIDSLESFSFMYKGSLKNKSCEWAGRRYTSNRCGVAEVALNCPKTCGTCS